MLAPRQFRCLCMLLRQPVCYCTYCAPCLLLHFFGTRVLLHAYPNAREREHNTRSLMRERDSSCMRERDHSARTPIREKSTTRVPQCDREGEGAQRTCTCVEPATCSTVARLVVQGRLVQRMLCLRVRARGEQHCLLQHTKRGETIETYICNICV